MESPRVYDRVGNSDKLLWEAVLVSCSAPTFFPPVNGRYVDGGLLLQNPSMVAVGGYMRECRCGMGDISLTSIDTDGHRSIKHKKSRFNILYWLGKLTKVATKGSENLVVFQCRTFPLGGYLYLSPKIEKTYPMDNVKIMGEYDQLWHSYYSSNRDYILNKIRGGQKCL